MNEKLKSILDKDPHATKFKTNPSKYIRASRKEIDGIDFDSVAESKRYIELKTKVNQGKIKGFTRQYRFIILDDFIRVDGVKIKGISYYADFAIELLDGTMYFEDVKGKNADLTAVFEMKKKLVENMYGIVIHIYRM